MAKKLPFAALAAVLFLASACNRDSFEATPPAYFSIRDIKVDQTQYATQGTAHSEITTAWIFANGQAVGAFELPAVIPILADGPTEIEVYPGINMNGIGATRSIYIPYSTIRETVNFSALDTASLTSPFTRYSDNAKITLVENFDESGLNLSASPRSDTSVIKTNDPAEIFVNPEQTEDNGKAGKIILEGERNFFELITTEAYSLPSTGQSVYLEMTYKTEVPIIVGVIAKYSGGVSEQAATLVVLPAEEWNKIYVNLISELTAYPGASGYQIFILGENQDENNPATVLLDNLKIVY
ncbi:MAG: hypothetical protein ACPF9D_03885 [Owenweeksia sp.]